MEAITRDILTRLATVLGNPQDETDADDLIEIFGDVEANRAIVSRQLVQWLESDAD